MTVEKVRVPKEVKEILDEMRYKYENVGIILAFTGSVNEKIQILRDHFADCDELMEALVLGYELEKTPEEIRDDKLREEYQRQGRRMFSNASEGKTTEAEYFKWSRAGFVRALDIAGIKVEGVNT